MRPKPKNLKLAGQRLLGRSSPAPRRSWAPALVGALAAHLLVGAVLAAVRLREPVQADPAPPVVWSELADPAPLEDPSQGWTSVPVRPAAEMAERHMSLPSLTPVQLVAPAQLISIQAPSVATWTLPSLPADPVGSAPGSGGQAPAGGETERAGARDGSAAGWSAGAGAGAGGGLPVYVRRPQPRYPATARQQGWQGTTILRVEVRADGRAGAIEVLQSSGHTVLDEAAQAAVRAARFGASSAAWVEVPITFRLDS